ncbi:MAG TPA: ATP-grasp domain-containing protein [Pirellulales bacterium]|nr:ATP-grasp domain-containing protein [Pirellulales bacterium]
MNKRRRGLAKKRVLVLMHEALVPPESLEGHSEKEVAEWKTEFDVVAGLNNLGHEVRPLGVASELGPIREAIEQWKPHAAFNLLEEFHGVTLYDQHVVSFLELMQQPYTGCNPRGLMLAHDKALCKKILSYHRVSAPDFAVFPKGKKIKRSKRLKFPLLVKSATEEASLGISQASIVSSDEKLADRVAFIHEHLGSDALVEEYIEGRELYVGVMGNARLTTFPIWEMIFANMPEGAAHIATAKVKWDTKYQKKHGIATSAAENLPDGVAELLPRLCKRVYRILGLSGYARLDFRLNEEGKPYLLEVNPNPNLAYGEDFSESAERAGISYEELLQRILNLALSYKAHWMMSY